MDRVDPQSGISLDRNRFIVHDLLRERWNEHAPLLTRTIDEKEAQDDDLKELLVTAHQQLGGVFRRGIEAQWLDRIGFRDLALTKFVNPTGRGEHKLTGADLAGILKEAKCAIDVDLEDLGRPLRELFVDLRLREVNDGIELSGQTVIVQWRDEVVLDPVRNRQIWRGPMSAKDDHLDLALQTTQQVTTDKSCRARDQDATHNGPLTARCIIVSFRACAGEESRLLLSSYELPNRDASFLDKMGQSQRVAVPRGRLTLST